MAWTDVGTLIVSFVLIRLGMDIALERWVPLGLASRSGDAGHLGLRLRIDVIQGLAFLPALAWCLAAAASRWRRLHVFPSAATVLSAVALAQVAESVLILVLAPGVVNGDVTAVPWATRDAYQDAQLDGWGFVTGTLFFLLVWAKCHARADRAAA